MLWKDSRVPCRTRILLIRAHEHLLRPLAMINPVLADVSFRNSTSPTSASSFPLARRGQRKLPCCVAMHACLGNAHRSLSADSRSRRNRHPCSALQSKMTAEGRRNFSVVCSAASSAATSKATVGDLVAEVDQLEKEMRYTFERGK